MRQLAGPRKSFCLAALAALAAFSAGELASAAETKVPKGDDIKKKLQDLYNGVVAPDNSTGRANVLVEVGKILDKDKNNVALKSPDFWTEAIQEGRFSEPAKKKPPTRRFAVVSTSLRESCPSPLTSACSTSFAVIVSNTLSGAQAASEAEAPSSFVPVRSSCVAPASGKV